MLKQEINTKSSLLNQCVDDTKQILNQNLSGSESGTKDHSKLKNRDLPNQHPIEAITGLEEALRNSGKINDVKVNNESVVSDKVANIKLKKINDQDIAGEGNIEIDVENVVKTTANQGLTNQQKINARNNIEALGSANVKQETGTSTTDVISQKGVTDLLNEKQSNKPNGVNLLISDDTGKIDLVYIPSTVLGGITNAGTFNSEGIIQASSYAPELDGLKIDTVELQSYPSYYFICSGRYEFAGYSFDVGDWAISLGNGWAKLNATDAVTSVNGKMGQVVLNNEDVGAVKKSWGTDNKNMNLVTDENGNVTVSEYSLGQIIVDYFEELPDNVPLTAKASVLYSSKSPLYYSKEYIEEIYNKLYEESLWTNIRFELNPKFEKYELTKIWIDPETGDEYDRGDGYSSIDFATEDGSISGHFDDTYQIFSEQPTRIVYGYVYYPEDYYELLYCWESIQYPGDYGEFITLNPGWHKIWYDPETGEQHIETINQDDMPEFRNVCITGLDAVDEGFFKLFYDTKLNLAGEYVYSLNEATSEKYWKYLPANEQADWEETDKLSLAYIKNKPEKGYLNTNNTDSLEVKNNEVLEGNIRLHKVSKTGEQEDIVHFVGKRNHTYDDYEQEEKYYGGEIFNDYVNNIAYGENSHVEGEKCQSDSKCSHVEGLGNISYYEGNYQHIQGKYANSKIELAHIIGNGSSDIERKNIHEIDWDGNSWYEGDVYVGDTENRKILAKLEDVKALTKIKTLTFTNNILLNDALNLPITSLKITGRYDEENFKNSTKSVNIAVNDITYQFSTMSYTLSGIDEETCNTMEINENGEVTLHVVTSYAYKITAPARRLGNLPCKPGGKIICDNPNYRVVLDGHSIYFPDGSTTEDCYVIYEYEEQQTIILGKIAPLVLNKGNNSIAVSTNAPSVSYINYSVKDGSSGAVGTLNTNNTSEQEVPDFPESLSEDINLHRIAKTGNYNHLIDTIVKNSKDEEISSNGGFVFNEYDGNDKSTAYGQDSISAGRGNTANGMSSLALGNKSHANYDYSYALGEGTSCAGTHSYAFGKYPTFNSDYVMKYGIGTDTNNRADSFTLDKNGNLWVKGKVYVGGNDQTQGRDITNQSEADKPKKKLIATPNDNIYIQDVRVYIVDSDIKGGSTNVDIAAYSNYTATWMAENVIDGIVSENNGYATFLIREGIGLPDNLEFIYTITKMDYSNVNNGGQ